MEEISTIMSDISKTDASASEDSSFVPKTNTPSAPEGDAVVFESASRDRSTLYIVLSILEILFCGGLLGGAALVVSLMYRRAVKAGRSVKAASFESAARAVLIFAGVMGLLANVYVFLHYLS